MLLQEAIQLEEYGGDVQCISISATKGTNLPQLVDAILLQVIVFPFHDLLCIVLDDMYI